VTVVTVLVAIKASDTHVSYQFLLCTSVFSSMHDRWIIQLFYKLLDPSSE
jgi:hypothetical protein